MSTVAPHGQCLAKVSLGQPLSTTIHRKHTFFGKKRIPLRKRVALHYVLRVQSQAGFGRGTLKIKEEAIEVETESEPSSGTKKFMNLPGIINLPGTVKLQAKGQSQAKRNNVIFVAGATGKVGSRTVRELLKLGFSVRAGTRNVEKAQALFEDVTQITAGSDDATPFGFFSPAKLFGFLKPKSGKMLEIVECDLEDAESIEPALGNAGVVVCCIGASEKEVLDASGPYRIDFKATANLIDAASSAQVNHFVLITSLGTQKFGLPAAVLNLFWGVLVWKAKAEKALLESGLPYTIVRPGGMERPTDAYKETHNLLLAEADKLFGGQVSNLQVAELLASIVENPYVSVNKIIEAVAETTAPLRPIRELLEEISAKDDTVSSPEPQSIGKARPPKTDDVTPQKVSKKKEEERIAEEKRALALKEKDEKRVQAEKLAEEKLAKAQKEKEEKRIRAENDEKEKLRLQKLRKKYEEEIEAAREKEEAANSAAAAALAEKAELEKRVAEVRAKAEAAALAASQAKAVEAAVVAAARKGNVLSDAEKEKIMESVKLARLSKEDGPKESKPSSKKKPAFSFFGKAVPSTETATDVESPEEMKEEQVKLEVESKAKAEKEAAAKLSEQKKQEERAKKAAAAKKLAEQEAAKALEAKQKEELDKSEKEAKEKAEKEASEAKRKEEELAEAKKKEEQEQAEKEAERLKIEADEKAKALAEQEKAEEEAKRLKIEAEKKAKALAEQEKAEKEAERLKTEAEEKAKALAEQEKAEKEAERLKIEAEERKKALAEQEAAAAAAEAEKTAMQKEEEPKEAPAPGRRKGFRWFWQPAEPDIFEEEETTKAEVADIQPVTKVTEQLPPSSTPLSPYTRYPGLKPPFPPIASPPTAKAEKVETPKIEVPVSSEINRVEQTTEEGGLLAKKDEEVVVEEPSPESQEDIEARARQVQEIAAREKEALEKAQAAISLKWLWQKPDPVEEDSASTSKEKESVASSEEDAASKSDALPRSSRPLSPYALFPNLKPPVPPRASIPVQSSTEEYKAVETLPKSSTPLSPYPGFPELKPPTAPTPLRNGAENGAVPESAVEQEEKIAGQEEKIAEPAFSSGFKWPWQQ